MNDLKRFKCVGLILDRKEGNKGKVVRGGKERGSTGIETFTMVVVGSTSLVCLF